MNTALNIKKTSIIALIFLVCSCSIRIIAPYDAVTDEKISALQEKVSLEFLEWKRSVPDFKTETVFYDETETTLFLLTERNRNIDKSTIIVSQLEKLADSFEIIKTEHEQGRLNKAFIEQIEIDIQSHFFSIQKLLMALKKAEED